MSSGTLTIDTGGAQQASSAQRCDFLFLVLEGSRPLAGGLRVPVTNVDEVRIGRGPESRVHRSFEGGHEVVHVELASAFVSSHHARLCRRGATTRGNSTQWVIADLDSRNGSFVDAGRVVAETPVRDGAVILVGDVAFVLRVDLPVEIRSSDAEVSPYVGLRTLRPDLAQRGAALLRVARSSLPVLLFGETGSGKELHARAVHEASGRPGRFVAINCAAIPPSLIESTLFGHRRGAFSGAVRDEPGLVRAAEGGTLFLDEIGDLPAASQAALLRVLQEREVLPLGGSRPVAVDVRIVSATHRPLETLVELGQFRLDLLARLRGYVYELSPLRARKEDLGLIIASLGARGSAQLHRIEPAAVAALVRHDYPMNVRETEHALGAAGAIADGGVITVDALPSAFSSAPASRAEKATDAPGEPTREALVALLEQHNGNVAAIARAVSRAPMQVRRWMKRLQLSPDTFRGPPKS